MPTTNTQPIFALDIGTRSVVGILLQNKEKHYQVIDYVSCEHKERSMVDGQIHDVLAVAEVIQNVKERLEAKHGKLEKVAVAAAGRSLKTKRARISKHIEGRPLMTKEDILTLELEAVQLAQAELAEEMKTKDQTLFYCVGYSVIRYTLDDEAIGNLIDQRGEKAAVEVIATFLPRVVVDSLISALKRAGLEMEALTLEPIASINVLIPSTMRRLNIALVDVGAGTSDIALTSEGAITAYGMVSCAGDEITEALSNEYILDFKDAEAVKRKLYCQEEVEFDDILGFHQQYPSTDVIKKLQPAIQQLATQISQEILALNGKAPQAVMLIGGGALTPTLDHWVAELLGLPVNRVGIRGLQLNQNVHFAEDLQLTGPEAVTPIGIAIAAEQHPVKYLSITVNQNTVRLFDLRKLTIGDAILASGMNINKWYGKPGLALSIILNGKLTYIPGTLGEAPRITCNGQQASIAQPLKENDQIEIRQGADGLDAQAKIKDVLGSAEPIQIYVNDQLCSLPPTIKVNGQAASLEYSLQERDELLVHYPSRIEDVLTLSGMDVEMLKPQKLHYYLNQEEQWVERSGAAIFLNGQPSSIQAPVQNGDHIRVQLQGANTSEITVADLLPEEYRGTQDIIVTFNGETVRMGYSSFVISMDNRQVDLSEPIQPGAQVKIVQQEPVQLCFQDVFRYVDIDLNQRQKGTNFVLKVNEEKAGFDTPIQHGDALELVWQ